MHFSAVDVVLVNAISEKGSARAQGSRICHYVWIANFMFSIAVTEW